MKLFSILFLILLVSCASGTGSISKNADTTGLPEYFPDRTLYDTCFPGMYRYNDLSFPASDNRSKDKAR